ncbi:hypothetical protein INR49_022472 [Caranx melampygus]|nr:hypothetical protein INR49_022472 [Caranx melampygus]
MGITTGTKCAPKVSLQSYGDPHNKQFARCIYSAPTAPRVVHSGYFAPTVWAPAEVRESGRLNFKNIRNIYSPRQFHDMVTAVSAVAMSTHGNTEERPDLT